MWLRDRKRRNEQAPAKTTLEAAFGGVPAAWEGAPPGPADGPEVAPAEAPPYPEPAGPGSWKMGLIVTASAFCGGIAVVLWNRRLLTKMREAVPLTRSDQQGRLWEDDL